MELTNYTYRYEYINRPKEKEDCNPLRTKGLYEEDSSEGSGVDCRSS